MEFANGTKILKVKGKHKLRGMTPPPKMTEEFNLSEELDKADWNIEDIWDISKPSAQEMVNKKIKEFIKETIEDIEGGYEGVELIERLKKRAGEKLR